MFITERKDHTISTDFAIPGLRLTDGDFSSGSSKSSEPNSLSSELFGSKSSGSENNFSVPVLVRSDFGYENGTGESSGSGSIRFSKRSSATFCS